MQRSEMVGLGVAVLGHAALFALLTLSFCAPPKVEPPHAKPIDVSLVDDVGLVATAPQSTEAPAESQAPDKGKPEDAAAAAKHEAEPDPTPPAPQPEAAPPPKPAPAEKQPPKKPAPPTPEKASTPPKRTAAQAGSAANAKAPGKDPNSRKSRQTGSLLGDNFLKGVSDKPSPSKSVTPQAPTMSAQAQADIASAIKRQVQPCADRQVKPGPGAERIIVTIRLRLNRDGSLAANPAITGHSGVDDENSRYQDRVDDNAIATFKGCSPLRGLPQELYDVEHGWSVFSMRYNLKG
jgi:outer membrane biosynthesis protein TonB